MVWTLTMLPGEQYSEEEYYEMQKFLYGALGEPEPYIILELEEETYADIPCSLED